MGAQRLKEYQSKLILFPVKASTSRKHLNWKDKLCLLGVLNVRGSEPWKLQMTLRTSKPLMLSVNPELSHDYGELEPRRLRKLKPTICQNLKNKLLGVVCTYVSA